jgi:putative hydrolase of the HAD superfamily
VSNEGRELTEFRIPRFGLASFIDTFVVSCFVRLRKPDLDIFRMALDVAQVEPENVVYIEDRDMFVETAELIGISGIVHRNVEETRANLAAMGLGDRAVA